MCLFVCLCVCGCLLVYDTVSLSATCSVSKRQGKICRCVHLCVSVFLFFLVFVGLPELCWVHLAAKSWPRQAAERERSEADQTQAG